MRKMSYEGGKAPACPPPPPWQRNSQAQMHLGLANQTLVTYAQNQPVYNTNIAMAQQQGHVISQMTASQMQPGQMYSQAVSYPSSRGLNPIAFGQQPSGGSHSSGTGTLPLGQTAASLAKSHGVFNGIGVVTKIQGDAGFIDKEVFFNRNVCAKGSFPKVGDRVLVEVNYSSKMPFKWNATRVQVVSSSGSSSMSSHSRSSLPVSHKSSSYSASSTPAANGSSSYSRTRSRRTPSPPRISESKSARSRDPRLRRDESPYRSDEEERRRRREREKEKHTARKGSTPDRRERSPRRSSPPKKRRTRAIPRYMVQVPNVSLTIKDADVLVLRKRYENLYVPSDFFYTNIKWHDAFPPNIPFSIHKPCAFHIMRKDVEPVVCGEHPGDPEDVDFLFSAKVMLMGSPSIEEMYNKCIITAEDKEKDDERDVMHPSRLINFLVGVRGKNEAMAIGGPWSPSLDGENPQGDVSVLIRTAIRNCKSLTGIDLTNCTQWYRFVELYYRRGEVVQKGRICPPRIETVVIFLPDVRSCIPTRPEWDDLHGQYRRTLDRILLQEDETPSDGDDDVTAGVDQGVVVPKAEAHAEEAAHAETPAATKEVTEEVAATEEAVAADGETTEKDEGVDDVAPENEPTHWSKLEPKAMKIQELRDELSARDISAKGLKAHLVTRLAKAIKAEIEAEELATEEAEQKEAKDEVKTEEEPETADESAEKLVIDEDAKEVEQTLEDDTKVEAVSEAVEVKEAEEVKEQPKEETKDEEEKVADEQPMNVDEAKVDAAEEKEVIEPTEKPAQEESMEVDTKEVAQEVAQEKDVEMEADGVEDGELKDDEECKKDEETEKIENPEVNENDESKKDIKDVTEAVSADSVDLTDLVVIDEVDTTKGPEKPKKSEKKPLDEREKQALEKKYTLPEDPQIIVHPSKVAKNGKFDCTMMSLSVLLDYRPEDTKEHTFEVSLFAELFNEMLMRDFGFNIYKALNLIPDKVKEVKKDGEKKGDVVTIEDSPGQDGTKDIPKKVTDEKGENKSKDEEDAGKNRRSRDKSSRQYDDSDDDTVSIRSGEKRKRDKDRQKYYTAYPDLLLSFVYFDQTYCGYIFEKHVEDLFYALGLDLSRSQIRKLVSKSVSREALHYRKLTDLVKEEKIEVNADDATKEKDNNTQDSLTEDVLKGNKIYLPVFKEMLKSIKTDEPPMKKMKIEPEEDAAEEATNFVVTKNGGIVDVDKLMGQMQRADKALEETEKQLIEMRKQICELQSANTKANTKIKDLSSDLRGVTRKLSDTEQTLTTTQKKCNDYYSILTTVNDRVAPVFVKAEKSNRSDSRSREPKEKERESKESPKSESGKKDE